MYSGFIVTKKPINLKNAKEVTGFNVVGKGELYAVFNINGKWQKIVGNELEDVPTQEPSFYSIVEEGNTLEELNDVISVPSLAGGFLNCALAMEADDFAPKFKFSIKVAEEGKETVRVLESQEYDVRGDIQSIEGNATENVTIEVSGYKNGKWLSYVALDKASSNYEKVKFRATLTVDEVGQKAVFNGVTLKAHPNDAVIPSKEVAIYTNQPVKDAKIYVVGNNKGIVRAFCSQTTPAQWKEIERITDNSFGGANGMLKLTLAQDGEATPEIEGYVIQE